AFAWGTVLAIALCGQATAGGPPPVCMVVDKVVFEPNATAPNSVQIWGTFIFLQDNKNTYGPPTQGYLHYTVVPGKEDECRRHWANLKKLADGHQAICYGRCHEPRIDAHVRKAADKPSAPDTFPLTALENGFSRADKIVDSTLFKELPPRQAGTKTPASEKR